MVQAVGDAVVELGDGFAVGVGDYDGAGCLGARCGGGGGAEGEVKVSLQLF